jgi:hypothetical protein
LFGEETDFKKVDDALRAKFVPKRTNFAAGYAHCTKTNA